MLEEKPGAGQANLAVGTGDAHIHILRSRLTAQARGAWHGGSCTEAAEISLQELCHPPLRNTPTTSTHTGTECEHQGQAGAGDVSTSWH